MLLFLQGKICVWNAEMIDAFFSRKKQHLPSVTNILPMEYRRPISMTIFEPFIFNI